MIKKVPVTVFTGYLGSGKTTIIKNVIESLDNKYKIVWLKNEFGDVEVDSQVAKESNIDVKEMLNGCLCCVLVGKMQNALEEILSQYNPDRIIIETSGSAYPAPIAWEIRKMNDRLELDSIINVVDAINFPGYKDKSYTAKMQSEYTDTILINKHEQVSKQELDDVLDDVYELNPSTPKIKTNMGKVDPDLIFGLDTKLFSLSDSVNISNTKSGSPQTPKEQNHYENEVDLFTVRTNKVFTRSSFEKFLSELLKKDFFRIKGMVCFDDGYYLLNYVFGRFDFQKLQKYSGPTQIVFMGKNFFARKKQVQQSLGLSDSEILD
jgi:G3E family GTPase